MTDRAQSRAQPTSRTLPADERDAEVLGREIFELVDRAVDYRGSHRGRPAASFRQMGVESLTTADGSPDGESCSASRSSPSRFVSRDGREIISCRGDSQILEEAAINGGRYTLMCTTRSGSPTPNREVATE